MKNPVIAPLTLALIFTMSTACGKKKKGGNGSPPPDPKATCEAQESREWKDNQCSPKPTPEEQCNADSAKVWQDGACTDKSAEAATPAPEAAPEANTGEKRTSIFPGFPGFDGGSAANSNSWNAICQFLPRNFLPTGTRGLALAGEENSGGFFGTSRLEWDELEKSFRERLEVFSSEDCDSNSFLEGFDMEMPFSSQDGGFFGGSGFFQDFMKRVREGRGSDSSSSFPFPFPFSSSRDNAE